jgi:hypothetical protein
VTSGKGLMGNKHGVSCSAVQQYLQVRKCRVPTRIAVLLLKQMTCKLPEPVLGDHEQCNPWSSAYLVPLCPGHFGLNLLNPA